MGMHYTDDQWKVITTHDRDLLVAAAAGSGKTAVLVERIIGMISDEAHPVDVDRLLIVTFTKAAAAEMRERIGSAIAKKVQENPENRHLRRQEALLHNAQITTIDSFCSFILKNNFNDIGLDPDFRTMEEGEKKLMLQDSMAEILEEFYAGGEEDFYHVVEAYCPDGREENLERVILKLYDYSRSCSFPEEWLQECMHNYEVDTIEELRRTSWMQEVMNYAMTIGTGIRRLLEEGLELAQMPEGPKRYENIFRTDLEEAEKLTQCNTYDEIRAVLNRWEWGRMPTVKDTECDVALKDRAKSNRDCAKNSVAKLKNELFADSEETVLADMRICRELVSVLVRLTLALGERFAQKKRSRKLIDFSDMEHDALRILVRRDENGTLVPTDTAREYQEYFHEIIVDEYQDSNQVQEDLLRSISSTFREGGRPNMFMVGDVKQSIYRFRLARPEIFMEKYRRFTPDGERERKIELSCNFRSRREVLDSVNDVFRRIMIPGVGNVEYDDRAALNYGANYPDPEEKNTYKTEYILLDGDGLEGKTARETEAQYVALRIRDIVGRLDVLDKENGLRKARYSDIAILLRKGKGLADTYHSVLTENHIPAHVQSSCGYFDALEVRTLLNMIKVLNNPYQDIPLFGVMRSLFGGFTDDEIAVLRAGRREHLYTTLRNAAQDPFFDGPERKQIENAVDITSIKEKAAALLDRIDRYREMALFQPIHQLLRIMVRETHYKDYLAVQPNGEQCIANVEMLIEMAVKFDASSYHGLFRFVQYIDQLVKYEIESGEPSILDENADVVHIITIHKSKGLEYPVCFLCGTGSEFNLRDTQQAVLMDVDLGIATKMIDVERRLTADSLYRRMMAERAEQEAIGEEIRVLYVAMTRAREKLIITGTPSKWKPKTEEILDKQAQNAGRGKPFDTMQVVEMKSYMKMLLTAISYGCDTIDFKEINHQDLVAMQTRQEVVEAGAYTWIHTLRQRAMQGEPADVNLYDSLRERFGKTYSHPELERLYVKASVSDLKQKHILELDGQRESGEVRMFEADTEEKTDSMFEESIPRFLREEEEVAGTTRGTAYHRVLELLDLAEATSVEQICTQMRRMVECNRMDASYYDLVNPKKICHFAKSSLADRMLAAEKLGRIWREQPFVFGLPADEVDASFPREEMVIIQGIIDVYFEEEDGLVVVDYKTDRIGRPQDLADRYRVQIDYYTRALEQMTGKPVKERILYSLYLQEEVPC